MTPKEINNDARRTESLQYPKAITAASAPAEGILGFLDG